MVKKSLEDLRPLNISNSFSLFQNLSGAREEMKI